MATTDKSKPKSDPTTHSAVIAQLSAAVMIPIASIDANPDDNHRRHTPTARIASVATSMSLEGQKTPVVVEIIEGRPGRYRLVAGFTRLVAALSLKWAEIRAVVEQPMTPLQRQFTNLIENMVRDDLTTYEQAVAFKHLKQAHGQSGGQISERLHKSQSYVNNLVRQVESLEPVILQRWEQECGTDFGIDKDGGRLPNVHRVCTMDWLQRATQVPREDQEKFLGVALGLVPDSDDGDDDEDSDGGGDGGNATQPGSNPRATLKQLKAALSAAGKLGKDDARTNAITETLKFAMGKKKSIKGVYTIGQADDKVAKGED